VRARIPTSPRKHNPANLRAIARAARVWLRDESGYALVELMAVTTILVIVLGAVAALGETTQRIAPKDTERAHAIREAQVGLHGMTRQLRQAYLVHANTPYTMEVSLLVNGAPRRFSYECDQAHPTVSSYNRCLRYEVVGGAKTGGKVVIDRLLNGPAGGAESHPVFTYETNSAGTPTYVHASIDVPAKGDLKNGHDHEIALSDGFYMRNRDG